jgi:hypothetical protein
MTPLLGRERPVTNGVAAENVPHEVLVTLVLVDKGLHTSIVVVDPDVTSSIMVGPT